MTTIEHDRSVPRASVLLVDDRPEKLIALEAVLSELDIDVVKAASGRDALRWVLKREFAAILLDVNMPGMDGFETAMLIRQRPTSERVPIIFITAYNEDLLAARGYSLGAVDYIVTPIVPDVLRTKVSVFVDLHNAIGQQRRHSAVLERHAIRLQTLTRASQTINSCASTDEIADATMAAARDILGSSSCAVGLLLGERRVRTRHLRAAGGARPDCADAVDELLRAWAGTTTRPGRVARLPACGARAAGGDGAASGFPRVECLLAPLVGPQGRHLGVVCTADKDDGTPFDQDDEALFLQLAQMCGIAIENLLFSQEHEANKLKEEFLSTLSHELRTPLTAILGWVRILRGGELDAAGTARALEVIERNAKLQSKLTDDLLDISRIAAGKLRLAVQPVVLQELLTAAAEAARPMADAKEVSIALRLPEVVEMIPGDPDRLQQVVWNLLTNAVKFTPRGGRVEVRLVPHPGSVDIAISDTGQGISGDFLPHVFERFRQADASSTRMNGGLGIGLAVVRHIVELHGGAVRAESAGEGLGATFTVTLPTVSVRSDYPVAAISAHALQLQAEPADLADLHGVRVMAVDDDADTRQLLKVILGRQGLQVRALGSVREALDAFEQFRPEVIVTDLAMPDEDGWAFIGRIRARHSNGSLPAIALSAYAGHAERTRSRVVGFDAHLAKPIDSSELLGTIAALVTRRRQATMQGGTTVEVEIPIAARLDGGAPIVSDGES